MKPARDRTVSSSVARDTGMHIHRMTFRDVFSVMVVCRVVKSNELRKLSPALEYKWNISDFFTKPLPKEKFEQFAPFIIVTVDPLVQKSQQRTVVMGKTV
jgi:hypothetical protein